MFRKIRVGPYIKPTTGQMVGGYDYTKGNTEAIKQEIDEKVGNAKTSEELYEAQDYFKNVIGMAAPRDQMALYSYLSAKSSVKMRELLKL